MTKLTHWPEWLALQNHYQKIVSHKMQDWFAEDVERFDRFSLVHHQILLDYSKNRITPETITLLCELAEKANLTAKIQALFSGELINATEKRAALHTALRAPEHAVVFVSGKNIIPDIQAVLQKMRDFTQDVREGKWRGATGKVITDIVNVGIGGSHAGPAMAVHALKDFSIQSLRCHFMSNIDAVHTHEVLNQIDPESTLFIISSKSFSTIETLTNANTIREWLRSKISAKDLSQHFVAVTAVPEKAKAWGIKAENIFPLWDWVGGRYSVWSAIGLPLALMIGMEHFFEFLRGAHEMDQHFKQTPFAKNMPVILGLLGIWYTNFFAAVTQAVIPYTHCLDYFPTHLQQLDMESSGKRVTHQGVDADYSTGPIIFGEQGCNSQHAFYQLLHQGPHLVPVDFLLVNNSQKSFSTHQDVLMASALSQAQAFMLGKTFDEARAELLQAGFSEQEALQLAPHKTLPGNRPSNVLFLEQLTPNNLGELLALYEHKVFVQGAIWDINSFDQWGVELGKQLLPQILKDLQQSNVNLAHDSSTNGLIQHYKKCREQS